MYPHKRQGLNSDRKYTNSIITLKYCYLNTLNLFKLKTGQPAFLMGCFLLIFFSVSTHSFQEVQVSVCGTFVCFLTGRQAEISEKCRPTKHWRVIKAAKSIKLLWDEKGSRVDSLIWGKPGANLFFLTEAQRWYKAKEQFKRVSMIKKSLSALTLEGFGSKRGDK